MAKADVRGWTVKVTGLPTNITLAYLARHLNVATHRVVIPRNQDDLNGLYAWINGFDSEQHANEFAIRWNGTMVHRKNIMCKTKQNIASASNRFVSQSRSVKSSYPSLDRDPNRSRQTTKYHHEDIFDPSVASMTTGNVRLLNTHELSCDMDVTDNHHSGASASFSSSFSAKYTPTHQPSTDHVLQKFPYPARDSSSSSRSSTQSQQGSCFFGSSCNNGYCPLSHPPDWHVCKDMIPCDDFACTASHQSVRNSKRSLVSSYQNDEHHCLHRDTLQTKCPHDDSCRVYDCPELHPPSRPKACHYGKRCHNRACLRLHPTDRQLCIRGAECLELECTYGHPAGRPVKCGDGIKCDNPNCSRLHPCEWNPPDDAVPKYLQSMNSSLQRNQHTLKSFKTRMAEREIAQLPILTARTEFCQRLEQEKLLVVTAETGSGKSTQLPQYAAEHFSGGLIVCTQPRVVAAVSLARRVADEYDGTSEGKSVGYQVGSGNRVHGTNIMFMTDAALIHESQCDSNLEQVRVLIIDEAHERSLNTDIVIGIAKILLEKRSNDFFVVIASATIDPTRFLTFFDRALHLPLSVPGRVFTVTDDYLPPPEGCPDQNLIELHVVPTVLRLFPNHKGHTLVFLHGQREIEQALKLFNRDIPDGCVALPLYGSLSSEEQERVLKFDDDGSQRRMVVFCTNVAETSLTIKGTGLVIDTGLAKEARFDMRRRLTIIETVRISKSSANQRKGRAGRTASGHCVRLYNENDLKRENIEPEILRSSLDLVILQLVRLGLDPRTFPFMDAPDTHVLNSSLELLARLSCIVNESTSTTRGELFAELSLDPRLSALMTNMYTDVGGERLLALTATIVAILAAPGSLFYMGGVSKEAKAQARSRVAVGASEYDSDLLYLCAVYKNWKKAGTLNPVSNTCITCQKIVPNRFHACRSCRTQHANANGLNNKILQIIDRSSDFYTRTIMNPRWKLTSSPHIVTDSDERDAIGEQLYKLFPEQLGHLLVYHLPDEGIRLIRNELRGRINDTSVCVQRIHNHGQQHFVTMSITQLPTGDYIVDRLHPVPSWCLPPIPVQNLFYGDNIGWMIHNEVRKILDERRSESWARWLVYEYDRRTCRVTIWGMESDKKMVESIVQPIFNDIRSKLAATTDSIECGHIQASFKSGLICSSIETMDNTLRLNLQHVPCTKFDDLQIWLQKNLGVHRYDIKENNFRTRTAGDNRDSTYEAPPFYIVFKSAEAFRTAMARIPPHNVCPQGTALSSSTTGSRMDQKETWGRQLIIITKRYSGLKTSQQILERLSPHVIDCRERGKSSRPPQPAIKLSNLPVAADEPFVRQALRPINPVRVNLRQSSADGTGSSSAHIFFNSEQAREQALSILQSNICQQPIMITIRTKKYQQLVQKMVMPTASYLQPKEFSSQTFLVTAVNREVALKLYTEIIPHLEPYWIIDSSATVTVLQSDLYPNIDELSQSIATQFGTHIEQQQFEATHHNNDRSSDKRFTFSGAPPPKTALAASMFAQALSPILIKLTSERQKRLFRELFDRNLIQTWCRSLNLKITEKNKWGTVLEIRGPQIQQGQLMRQIADYSDQFDDRFRVHDLSTTTGNLFSRQKTASVKLDEMAQKWSVRGCGVSYIRMTNSIVIYAQPETNQEDIQMCESEVKQMVVELAACDDASRDKRECVFCRRMSASTRVFRICGHAYCQCVSSVLSLMFPLQCHEPTCKTNIHIQDLQEIFAGRRELTRMCKRSLQSYLTTHASTDDRLFCPNDECDGLLRKSAGYQICLTCGRSVCVLCRIIDDDLHEGLTCAERQKVERDMGEFLPRLFKAGEKYVRDNWTPDLPHIIRMDRNLPLIEPCLSLQRFYKGVTILGDNPPPELARGFFAFHGTAADSIESICTHGFDPNRRQGQVHGAGEYFGVSAAISDGYCRRASEEGVKIMLLAFVLRCNQVRTIQGFCHVVNNPNDWSYAYNIPVLVISYGNQVTAPAIFGTYRQLLAQSGDQISAHALKTNSNINPNTTANISPSITANTNVNTVTNTNGSTNANRNTSAGKKLFDGCVCS